ncbi:MAG: ABC transporter ATP-binding protein [Streptomycetaceae bacterium]|jgi:branched-chain amino acid transport system ATP-binding protein|nr:MAG: ABC transporter ATP-binding protein [Streptomycetaceae bacterium]
MSALLEVKNLKVGYGKIIAVKDISITVNQGEIVTLIGSNGAGKSTTLRTISGLLKPKSGEILFEGNRIDGKEGHEVVKLGLCQSPEGRRIFPRMTVSENLDLGAFLRTDKDAVAADRERVLNLFPRLRERISQRAGTMSGGEQQMLAVSRAMMGAPKLLMLDEPSMGLAPVLVDMIFETITKIRDQGITILLIEQNAAAALDVADRAYVLESGTIKMSGKASDLAKDPAVTKAYLGG